MTAQNKPEVTGQRCARHLQAALASPGQAEACPTARRSRNVSASVQPNRSAFWRYVGQVGNLRRVGNPPLSGTGQSIGRPITNRPQDATLPYIAGLEPQRAGFAKSSRRAKTLRSSNARQNEQRS